MCANGKTCIGVTIAFNIQDILAVVVELRNDMAEEVAAAAAAEEEEAEQRSEPNRRFDTRLEFGCWDSAAVAETEARIQKIAIGSVAWIQTSFESAVAASYGPELVAGIHRMFVVALIAAE
jgi:hypothetical protein